MFFLLISCKSSVIDKKKIKSKEYESYSTDAMHHKNGVKVFSTKEIVIQPDSISNKKPLD